MGGSIMGNAGRVLMIPKGDYNPATPYEMLDCVYYNGRSYVCKQASTGNAPTNTTYWQALTGDASAEIQALTNKLTDEAETRSALGAKNLLSQNPLTTFTESGVTITRNADGSITVSTEAGGATARVSNVLHDFVVNGSVKDTSLNGKRIILSGCPAGGSSSTYYIQFFRYDGSTTAYDYGEGTEPLDVNVGTTDYVNITMRVESGTVITTPITFKPMIRLATDSDPTYQPYAKTNVELTQDVAVSNNNTHNKIASAKYGHVNVVTMSGASLSDGDSISAYVASLPISNNVPWAVMFDGASHTNVTVYLQVDGVVRLIDSTGHTPSSAMTLYGQLTYIN